MQNKKNMWLAYKQNWDAAGTINKSVERLERRKEYEGFYNVR